MTIRWQPIQDYVRPHHTLAEPELAALAQVWTEQHSRLKSLGEYTKFRRRLVREWAIETGLVEGLYKLDRGTTELLIEHGIKVELIPSSQSQNPAWVAATISDHKEAVDGLFDFVRGTRELSTSYIKELHAVMTRHQEHVDGVDSLGRRLAVPLLRGAYKRLPNNPSRSGEVVHEYCPPEHVASEMDLLIALHQEHADVAPEVEAAWLHHRLTQIHPFQDGNGRVARTLATLVFIKASWFPLVVPSAERARYIDALESADEGDLGRLVRYFARLQRHQFVRALHIVEEVRQERRVRETIAAVRRSLQRRRDALVEEWESAKSVAAKLRDEARDRFSAVADELKQELSDVLWHSRFFADGASDGCDRDQWFRSQIIQAAKKHNYFADLRSHRSWARLGLENTNQTMILAAFHGIGREFRGVLACSALWFQRVSTDDGERENMPVRLLSDSPFLINYKESADDAKQRFRAWLDTAISRGLVLWEEFAY